MFFIVFYRNFHILWGRKRLEPDNVNPIMTIQHINTHPNPLSSSLCDRHLECFLSY